MFGAITEAVSRRRALVIAPLALGGAAVRLVASRRSRGGGENVDVTIVEFDDSGRKLGAAVRKKVMRSDSDWRRQLTPAAVLVGAPRLDRHALYRHLLPTRKPQVCSAASAAETRCSVRQPSLIPAPAGPVSARPSPPKTYYTQPDNSLLDANASRSCAGCAMRTWATCLTTGLRPPACAIASTSRRCDSFRLIDSCVANSPMRLS